MAESQGQIAVLLRTHPIWRDSTEPVIRALSSAARLGIHRPGQVLVREGQAADRVHLLVGGAARTFYVGTKSRPELTVKLLRAPSAFGDVACVLRVPYSASVEALTETRSVEVESQVYFAALLKSPGSCLRQYFDLAERFGGAVQIEKSTYAASLHERVIALLAAYARELGVPVEDGIRIEAWSKPCDGLGP
ncbi:MAG: cyclic nucleotide-binding domain-containing protein [Deltaproteobacteria bacterium]|nr:cyclic nucleotide-binding domain-containing protein [Deltaproteobacteria bacterium]